MGKPNFQRLSYHTVSHTASKSPGRKAFAALTPRKASWYPGGLRCAPVKEGALKDDLVEVSDLHYGMELGCSANKLQLRPKGFAGARTAESGLSAMSPEFAERMLSGEPMELTSHPSYLATRTLSAEHWAVKRNDRTANVNADPGSIPRVHAENLCEQRKSRELLKQTEELF